MPEDAQPVAAAEHCRAPSPVTCGLIQARRQNVAGNQSASGRIYQPYRRAEGQCAISLLVWKLVPQVVEGFCNRKADYRHCFWRVDGRTDRKPRARSVRKIDRSVLSTPKVVLQSDRYGDVCMFGLPINSLLDSPPAVPTEPSEFSCNGASPLGRSTGGSCSQSGRKHPKAFKKSA